MLTKIVCYMLIYTTFAQNLINNNYEKRCCKIL